MEAFFEKAQGDAAFREQSGRIAADYCRARAGATEAIMEIIFG